MRGSSSSRTSLNVVFVCLSGKSQGEKAGAWGFIRRGALPSLSCCLASSSREAEASTVWSALCPWWGAQPGSLTVEPAPFHGSALGHSSAWRCPKAELPLLVPLCLMANGRDVVHIIESNRGQSILHYFFFSLTAFLVQELILANETCFSISEIHCWLAGKQKFVFSVV